MSKVLESTREIAAKSRLVQIDHDLLAPFCEELMKGGSRIPTWDEAFHFNDGTAETVTYLLVLDTLNACFWPSGLPPILQSKKDYSPDFNQENRMSCLPFCLGLVKTIQHKLEKYLRGGGRSSSSLLSCDRCW